MDLPDSLQPEALFRESAWIRRLALSMVRDESTADDVVQATIVEAWARPPKEGFSLPLWLRTVVRNFAWKTAREEKRRKARERAAARPERVEETADVELERLELHRWLAGVVLSLREPYRSTVLLKFYEELNATQIAARQGVTPSTVRNRLSRALEQIRERLDQRHRGNRSAWTTVIVPVGLFEAAQKETAISVTYGFTVGGVAMKKAALFSALAVIVLASAIGGGAMLLTQADREPLSDVLTREQRLSLQSENDRLLSENERLRHELGQTKARNRQLDTLVGTVKRRISELEASADSESDSPTDSAEALVDSPTDRIEWERFAKLFDVSIDALVASKGIDISEIDPEQRTQMMAFVSELLKLSSQAREISDYPFFSDAVLPDFVKAVFDQSLGLSDGQRSDLDEATRAVLADHLSTFEPSEGLPIERIKAHQEIVAELSSEVESLLDESQFERWEDVRRYGELALQGRVDYRGYPIGEGTSKTLLQHWENDYGFDSRQLDQVHPVAETYVREAENLLARYGQLPGSTEDLSGEAERKLERDFLDLQVRMERQLAPFLSEDQLQGIRRKNAVVIQFNHHGRAVSGNRGFQGVPSF